MQETVRIPEERKAVLIGKGGRTKRDLEKKTNTRMLVSSDVTIEGDALDVLKATEIVKAIARGFNPRIAMLLLEEDFELCIINLRQKDKALNRTLARIIGTRGKAKRNIEEWTGAHVCVYGRTISIIGTHDSVTTAENAIELLIEGKSHSFVYGRIRNAMGFRITS